MKISLCIAIVLLLFNSCSVYQKTPTSIQQAYNQGKGKVVYTTGIKQKFTYISLIDSTYYINVHGREKVSEDKYEWMNYKKEVDSTTVSGVHLRKKKEKPYKIKIIFQDKREPIRGYLYSATDSTIILIPTNSKYQITESSAKLEIPISQIKKVNKSVKKAATIGFIPGFIGGAMFGVYGASWGGSNTPLISYISTGLAIGIIYGTITALASTFISRKVYSIKGDIAKYRSKHLGTLQMRSNSNIELIAK